MNSRGCQLLLSLCLMLAAAIGLAVSNADDSVDWPKSDSDFGEPRKLSHEVCQIITTILMTAAPIENDSWQHQTYPLLYRLKRLVRETGQQGDVLEYLFSAERARLFIVHNKQRLLLALKYWTMNSADLVQRGDLFLHLINETVKHPVPRGWEQLVAVARSMTASALAVKGPDGRTPFELYLDLLCADPDLDTEVAVLLAERSPDAVVESCRLATVSTLPAQVWSRVFHRRNRAISVLDDALHRSRDPDRLFTEITLSRIRYADQDSVADELRRIFPTVDPQKFLLSCRGMFDYFLDEKDVLAIWNLATYYNHAFRNVFLQKVPYMFATLQASYRIIVGFINKILFAPSAPDWHICVLRRLLSFHLVRHGPIGIWLADRFASRRRYNLLRMLLRVPPDDRQSDMSVLRAGLQASVRSAPVVADDAQDRRSSHAHKPSVQSLTDQKGVRVQKPYKDGDERLINDLLMGLALRTLFESSAFDQLAASGFVEQLPQLDNESLRTAFMIASSALGFDVDAVKVAFPALYNRLNAVLPQKFRPNPGAHVISPMAYRTDPLPPICDCYNIVDEYEILGVLGEGMFGTVFRARPVGSSSEVAIKVQRTDSPLCAAETDFMRRCCAGPMPAPGLVRLLDVFNYGPDTYLVMTKVKGQPLGSWTIPPDPTTAYRRLLVVIFQILVVLERLHQAGLEHGDIQHLNNFLLNEKTGSLTLIDFGLSGCRGHDAMALDHSQLYMRLTELLDSTRRRMNLFWWEPSPAPLSSLEAAIAAWPYWNWSLAGLIAHPIFDDVRDLSDSQHMSRVKRFPVLPAPQAPRRRRKWLSSLMRLVQRRF